MNADRHVYQSSGNVAAHVKGGDFATHAVVALAPAQECLLDVHADAIGAHRKAGVLRQRLHQPEGLAGVLARVVVLDAELRDELSLGHQGHLDALVEQGHVSEVVSFDLDFLDGVVLRLILVHVLEVAEHDVLADVLEPNVRLIDIAVILADLNRFLQETDINIALVADLLLPALGSRTCRSERVLPEDIFVDDEVVTGRCCTSSGTGHRVLFFDFEHLLLELIEVDKAKQRIDSILLHFLINLEILLEILVKGSDLRLRIQLEQLGVNYLRHDLHILLKNSRVLQLVLVLLRKSTLVLLHEFGGRRCEFCAAHQLGDRVENGGVLRRQ